MKHAYEMEYHAARLETENLRQQPFYLICGTLSIDLERPLAERWVAQYGECIANGGTPAEAVRRFNEVWTHGRYLK
jgi:hypothetical protein